VPPSQAICDGIEQRLALTALNAAVFVTADFRTFSQYGGEALFVMVGHRRIECRDRVRRLRSRDADNGMAPFLNSGCCIGLA
jgi:hypothetical protein